MKDALVAWALSVVNLIHDDVIELIRREAREHIRLPECVLARKEHFALMLFVSLIAGEHPFLQRTPHHAVCVHALRKNIEPMDEEKHAPPVALRVERRENRLTRARRHHHDRLRPAAL